MPALAPVPLGHIEGHRAERSSELVSEIAIVPPDLGDDGSEERDRLEGDFEDLKAGDGRFGLHAPPRANEP